MSWIPSGSGLIPTASDKVCSGVSTGFEGVTATELDLETLVGASCLVGCIPPPSGPGSAAAFGELGAAATFTVPSSWPNGGSMALNFTVPPGNDPSDNGIDVNVEGYCLDSPSSIQAWSDLYLGVNLTDMSTGVYQTLRIGLLNTTTYSCTYDTGSFLSEVPVYNTPTPAADPYENLSLNLPMTAGVSYTATFYFGCQASLEESVGGSTAYGATFCTTTTSEDLVFNSVFVYE